MSIRRIDGDLWELPREGRMRVPGRVYSAGPPAPDDPSLEQVRNVAHLPGILRFSLAMPDIHWGYGFPIGGVAAVDLDEGAVSPGGVGYDINCGVRLVTTALPAEELRPHLRAAAAQIQRDVPAGVGASRAIPRLGDRELSEVLADGARWAVRRGFAAAPDDAERCEEGGRLDGADPEVVSPRARERGFDQLGTLGSGNHFLELDEVDEIHDASVAEVFGLSPGQVVIQIHSGSRGLGYQICDETLAALTPRFARFGPDYAALPDRQLACAPVQSPEGREYLGAMQAAANFAWANRQVMTGLAVRALQRALGLAEGELSARVLYDVCHNVAKVEEHRIDGTARRVLVHRKGATRAFGPGDPRVPAPYRAVGQPVLIPGDMGATRTCWPGPTAPCETPSGAPATGPAGSSPGARLCGGPKDDPSRTSSRSGASRCWLSGKKTLGEEMSDAYKDVADVVGVMARAGISRVVARLVPLAVIKG